MTSKYMQALMDQMSQPGADQTVIPGIGKQASDNIVRDLMSAQQSTAQPQSRQSASEPPAQQSQPINFRDAQKAMEGKQETTTQQVVSNLLRKVAIKDDFGDDQEIELDLGNDEKLKEIASALHKTKHYESELELIRSQLAAKEKAIAEFNTKYGKLTAASSAEEMAEIILADKGGLDAIVKQKMQEREEFNKLSSEEQKALLARQEEQAKVRQFEKMQKDLDEKMNKIRDAEKASQKEAELTLYRQATAKYCPVEKDNPKLLKVNKLIWDEAHAELSELKKQGVTLTSSIVEQKFQKAYMANKELVQSVKSSKGNSVLEATQAATSNPASVQSKSAADGVVDEGALLQKWYNLTVAGKGGDVIAEVMSNPKVYQPIYGKLASRFRR